MEQNGRCADCGKRPDEIDIEAYTAKLNETIDRLRESEIEQKKMLERIARERVESKVNMVSCVTVSILILFILIICFILQKKTAHTLAAMKKGLLKNTIFIIFKLNLVLTYIFLSFAVTTSLNAKYGDKSNI